MFKFGKKKKADAAVEGDDANLPATTDAAAEGEDGAEGAPKKIADDPAKHHLQQVFRRTLDPAFAGRVAFIDDYDLHVAHCLVGG